MIRVIGLEVPRTSIAQLAVNLQHSGQTMLAHHMGHAIDHNLDELVLTPNEYEPILHALTRKPIAELEGLRKAVVALRSPTLN